MKILAYKTVSYEDAIDAVICAENKLPIKNNLSVNYSYGRNGPVAVVEPLDLDEANLTGEENENYVVIRKS